MSTCAFCELLLEREPKVLNVLELYSGIGGANYALESLKLPVALNITAMDINTNANVVHSLNFPRKSILQRNLLSLSAKEVDDLAIDLLTMSPPCQPFTRQGLKKDLDDNRSDSFSHIIQNVLPNLKRKPSFILLENVQGFEGSEARQMFVKCLQSLDYSYREFLLSPSHLNIPNSRLRYYIIAKLEKPGAGHFIFDEKELVRSVPTLRVTCDACRNLLFPGIFGVGGKIISPVVSKPTLEQFIRQDAEMSEFALPDKILNKYSFVLDIVKSSSSNTCCFTSGYGHLIQGTGSVLQTNQEMDTKEFFADIPRWHETDSEEMSLERISKLRALGLRYFSPREVANLMCFPQEFSFPDTFSSRQRFKLLGNSVNIAVIAFMLKLLFASNSNH